MTDIKERRSEMKQQKHYIAVDLGASNGRIILGKFDKKSITVEELYRFSNDYIQVNDAYYWDILHLYSSIIEGLKAYGRKYTEPIFGIGIDTWGVDFGLIDSQGRLAGNPRAYRDARGLRGMKAFHEKYGERTAFNISGNANFEYNTLYQLYDMVQSGDPQLEAGEKLLLMPDLIAYMLCGEASCEYTHASTTQMLDGRDWSQSIVEMLGIKRGLLPEIKLSGEKKGELYPHIIKAAGLSQSVTVYCVGSHDTASAVASVPASTKNYAFLSSGTWSLMGIENDKLINNDVVFENTFTNEGTITGGYRLIRNIMGLWIIQSCKREWDHKKPISWDEIVSSAKEAPAFQSFIDVDDHMFFDGSNMVDNIKKFCRDSGQKQPETIGEIARTVYESLAMCYREAFIGLEQLQGGQIDVLHIVGGGSKNAMLNQMTANAINRMVVAGPAEATAIGNLMVQIEASGEVKDLAEMRSVIRESCDVKTYSPMDVSVWADGFERYKEILKK